MAEHDLNDIEAQVARDRADLARSLDILGETLSPDRLKDQAARTADSLGKDIGGQAWDAARENPAAFALVGAGLALLLSGAGRRGETDGHVSASPQAAESPEAMQGFDERVAKADAQIRRTAQPPAQPSRRQATARHLRDTLSHGLDKLPPDARRHVTNARLAAIDAQETVERHAARIAQKSSAFVTDQPIAVGAAAFGIGALIATILPGTRPEDETMGRTRDALMARAGDALRTETEAMRDNVTQRLAPTGANTSANTGTPPPAAPRQPSDAT